MAPAQGGMNAADAFKMKPGRTNAWLVQLAIAGWLVLAAGAGPSAAAADPDVDGLLSEPLSLAQSVATTTYVLAPEADATVDSTSPDSNSGREAGLEVHRGWPPARTYLRFSLPPMDGPIVWATLQLHPETSSLDGFSVHPEWDRTWGENSITYANAPAWDAESADVSTVEAGVVRNVDVTGLIRDRGPVSFVLTTDGAATSSPIRFSSRESSHPPRLVVRTLPAPVFADDFQTAGGPNNLVTNEHAFWNLRDLLAVRSSDWEVTSGSLFSRRGVASTGVPDLTAPDRYSLDSTGSGVFRMRTVRSNFGDNLQVLHARINDFHGFAERPAVPWDGVVVWPRYATEFNLYFAYALRKDGKVSLTKKCPGGDPNGRSYYNGGTYYGLTPETSVAPTVLGRWYSLATSAKDNVDGSVTISLYRGGEVVAQATDRGTGCPPIHGPTKLGLRADNVDASFSHYGVSPLP